MTRLGVQIGVLLWSVASSSLAHAQLQKVDGFYAGELMFSADEEAEYLRRFERAQVREAADEIYFDQEVIEGVPDYEPLPTAAPNERTISEPALLDAFSYAATNNSNAFIVWRKGQVEMEAYFGKHQRESPVISHSLAKQVTAFAVGRALMLGAIDSLDQPVADFVTEWQGDARREKILVRHLLDMRTGFLGQGGGSDPRDVMSRTFLHPRHDEIIIAEYPVTDEPGTRYEYNNAASEMVAVLIERATGRRYAEFVGTEIWQKIGAMGGAVWVNRTGGMAHAGCCMMVPADNFLRLGILMLQDGEWDGVRLLPNGYVREMITPTAENPYYGFSIWVAGRYTGRRGFSNPDRGAPQILHSEPYLADDLYLFDGNANQVVYVIPSQDLVILRTGLPPVRAEGVEWDNAYLPNTIMHGIIRDKGDSKPQQR